MQQKERVLLDQCLIVLVQRMPHKHCQQQTWMPGHASHKNHLTKCMLSDQSVPAFTKLEKILLREIFAEKKNSAEIFLVPVRQRSM